MRISFNDELMRWESEGSEESCIIAGFKDNALTVAAQLAAADGRKWNGSATDLLLFANNNGISLDMPATEIGKYLAKNRNMFKDHLGIEVNITGMRANQKRYEISVIP